ncbi:beta-ketoacyl synthase chain length factor [Dyadobacter sp. NIV53]|uniref:beta-ketoacyl synthase chain length factor n=1 Tax=Dyadobacter sp. NIV53 TaxID=2861765 RepID=UPI001E4461F9|nr:beta-ketoacyl synthase chain length factor [Dyadobacter sp. NIV53]
MPYISAVSTISHQPTFKNAGFSGSIEPLKESSELIVPNFKDYIDAGLLRRMSKILRMSVTCAKDCLEQSGIKQPDSIIVGTGLGCLQDTEKFLNNYLTIEGLLPPTSFIQSTHNTIAGQISLSIGNHGYNMTHTQNSLSFEHALLDGLLLLNEEDKNVLVGAADEHIEILNKIGSELNLAPVLLSSGASFFMLSNEKTNEALARITDVETIGFVRDIPGSVDLFLENNSLERKEIDQVLYCGFHDEDDVESIVHNRFDHISVPSGYINYSLYSGMYFTNSAFALHFAIDSIQVNKDIRNVLICNNLNKINLGLTLVQSIEA